MNKRNDNTYYQTGHLQEIPMMLPQKLQRNGQNIGSARRAFKSLYPMWLTQNGVAIYLLVLSVATLMYFSHSLPWYYMLSGVAAVLVFFYYGSQLIEQTSVIKIRKDKRFEKRIFWISFALRVTWMFFIYIIFMQNYGDAFGFENSDAAFYDDLGYEFKGAIENGNFFTYWRDKSKVIDVSDMGYGAYVGFIYFLTGYSIIAVRFLKCIWSSLMVVLIYRLAKRNFDPQVARMTAIFCALWPNFWYYCGGHLKETEMVFLAALFVEQADQMLRSRQFTAWQIIPVIIIGAILFTFRTPLALVAFLSLIFSVVVSSSRVVKWGKRVTVGVLALLLIAITFGNQIQEQTSSLLNEVKGGQQEHNMEWRTEREHGNKFAKYAGKSVFAPLIFTIPFPSMVRPWDGQEQQQLLNGGNFIKNIISFFTILAMVVLLISGKWRDHLLPLSFLLGYLVVLTMSTFAQSERFHQPAMPFEFMFAAYGLSIALTKAKYKRWFTYWCGVMFVACIVWNWFKMAGRGL